MWLPKIYSESLVHEIPRDAYPMRCQRCRNVSLRYRWYWISRSWITVLMQSREAGYKMRFVAPFGLNRLSSLTHYRFLYREGSQTTVVSRSLEENPLNGQKNGWWTWWTWWRLLLRYALETADGVLGCAQDNGCLIGHAQSRGSAYSRFSWPRWLGSEFSYATGKSSCI